MICLTHGTSFTKCVSILNFDLFIGSEGDYKARKEMWKWTGEERRKEK
jgi:hypothetical protein